MYTKYCRDCSVPLVKDGIPLVTNPDISKYILPKFCYHCGDAMESGYLNTTGVINYSKSKESVLVPFVFKGERVSEFSWTDKNNIPCVRCHHCGYIELKMK